MLFWIYRMIHGIVLWYNSPGGFSSCRPPKGHGSFRVKVKGRPDFKGKVHQEFKVKGCLGVKCERSLRVKVKGHPRVNVEGHSRSKSKVTHGSPLTLS